MLAIHVEGEADGQLNPGDFLEFYGERNDGKLDVQLYKDPTHHINPYYSNYTDSAAYFLTWSSAPGNRMGTINPDPSGLTPETYHKAKSSPFNLKDLSATAVLAPLGWPNQYSRGQRYSAEADNQFSWGDEAEGWGFVVTPGNSTNPRNYRLDSLVNIPFGADTFGLPKPTIKLVFTGGSETIHKMDIYVGQGTNLAQNRRIAADVTFGAWNAITLNYTLNFKDILKTNGAFLSSLVIQVVPKNYVGGQRDRVRFIVAELTYPQKFDLAGKPRMLYPDPAKPVSLFQITNPPADAIAYDLSNLQNISRITGTVNGNQETFVFNNNTGAAEPRLYVASGSSYLTPASARPVTFANISAADRNYIIISHKDLMQPTGSSSNPVQDYA
ncbi:MAG: hypothetical protein EOP50_15885, partial [Sphingobacteriales bacterium]